MIVSYPSGIYGRTRQVITVIIINNNNQISIAPYGRMAL